eukprot:3356178-Pyramimonas_sp.AAC.1
MKRTKKDVRKEFKEKSREGQREFLQIWKKTGNFNHAECMKTESRSHVDKDDTNSDWFNWDDLCKACGWTPENAKTLVGERIPSIDDGDNDSDDGDVMMASRIDDDDGDGSRL